MVKVKYYFIITEVLLDQDYDHGRYFRFALTGYRESVSYNAFFIRGKRCYNGKKRMYHQQQECEFKSTTELMEKETDRAPGLRKSAPWLRMIEKRKKIIDVADIWEFYRAIGYDYKSQKYLPDFRFPCAMCKTKFYTTSYPPETICGECDG